MRILFDRGTPVPLQQYLAGHSVETAFERGWSDLQNGDLLERVEGDGFQLLITTDQNLRHQQNLADTRLAVLVLLSTSWPRIRIRVDDIRVAVDDMGAGDSREMPI